jgi:hypothetical protein
MMDDNQNKRSKLMTDEFSPTRKLNIGEMLEKSL